MSFSLINHSITADGSAGNLVTAGLNTSGANLLVACYVAYPSGFTTGSGTVGPVSDGLSNTWNYLTPQEDFGAGNAVVQMAYAVSPTVGVAQTFTLTKGSFQAVLQISAWSSGLPAYDNQQNGANASVSSLASGNVTPSVANDLIISALGGSGASVTSYAVTNGFTILDTFNNQASNWTNLGMAYLLDSGTSAIGTTWSQSASSDMQVVIAAFSPGANSNVAFSVGFTTVTVLN